MLCCVYMSTLSTIVYIWLCHRILRKKTNKKTITTATVWPDLSPTASLSENELQMIQQQQRAEPRQSLTLSWSGRQVVVSRRRPKMWKLKINVRYMSYSQPSLRNLRTHRENKLLLMGSSLMWVNFSFLGIFDSTSWQTIMSAPVGLDAANRVW